VLDELASGSVRRTYAYSLQRISENQISSTWKPSFYGYDGHGNVRLLSNTTAASTDSYDFDAFGMPVRTSGTTPNQLLYSGERYDSSISVYDLRARYYDQATGRFWARDPVEGVSCTPLTYNPYIYAEDDPADQSDPTGQYAAAETLTLNWRDILTIPAQILLRTALLCAAEEDATGFGSIFYNGITGNNPLDVQQDGPCVVKPKKTKWTCDAQCQIQDYSGGTGVSYGPVATGGGSSKTAACLVAKAAAVALTPRGSYPRHCQCFNCSKR
jgi:RHS repeat-associated protein